MIKKMKALDSYIIEKFKINRDTIKSSSLFSHIIEVINTVPLKEYNDNSADIEPLIRYWLREYKGHISCYSTSFEYKYIGELEFQDLSLFQENFEFIRNKWNQISKNVYYKTTKKKDNIHMILKSDTLLVISFRSLTNPIVFEKE